MQRCFVARCTTDYCTHRLGASANATVGLAFAFRSRSRVSPAHLAPSIILTVPDISPEDRKGFIQIQAEQQLPLPLSEIHLATHEFQIGNQNHALVVAREKVQL